MHDSFDSDGSPRVAARVLSIGAADDQHRRVEQLLSEMPHLNIDAVNEWRSAVRRAEREAYDVVLVRSATADNGRHLDELRQATSDAVLITIEDGEEITPSLDAVVEGRFRLSTREPVTSVVRCVLDAAERRRLRAEIRTGTEALRQAEARFQNIIEKTGDGILILSSDRIIRFANPAAEVLFGRRSRDLIGTEFGHTVIAGETAEIDIVRGQGREPSVAEVRVTDTEWDGEAAQLVSLRDVSDRKAAEERARRLLLERAAREQAEVSARRSQLLSSVSTALDEAPDLSDALDRLAHLVAQGFADWCLVDRADSSGKRKIVGRHRDSDLTRTVRHLRVSAAAALASSDHPTTALRLEDAVLFRTLDPEGLRTVAGGNASARRLAEIGTRSMIVVSMSTADEQIGHVVLGRSARAFDATDLTTAIDIAERACRKIQNAMLYEAALIASKAKSDFLAVISHELRTPLNAILGYGQILMSGIAGALDDRQVAYLQRIDSSAHHLLRIIDEILAFRMVEQGADRARLQPTTVRALTEDVVPLAKPLLREKGIDFQVRTDQPEATLVTDSAKVKQILLSLLSNAAKFTEEGHVELRVDLDEKWFTATVTDSGIGIAPEHLISIFESFWQAEPTYTRSRGGTGLGLSVARRLARLLDGDLEVSSEPGVGSRFTLRIPRYPPGGDGQNGDEGGAVQ